MRFRKIYIEITNVCGQRCAFCPRTTRPARFMNVSLFSTVLDQFRGLARRLHLHVMGEPLLHPRLPEILDLCGSGGFEVNLITNGRPLAAAGTAILGKPALRQVGVSLHSLTSATGDDELQAYAAALAAFVTETKAHSRLKVSLRLWDSGADPGLEERVMDALRTAGVDLSPRSSLTINRAERFEWPDPAAPVVGDRGTCFGLRDQVAVLADGTVVPCCLDRNAVMALGRIPDQPLSAILAGPRATAIRDGFSAGAVVEDLCRRCSYRQRFR